MKNDRTDLLAKIYHLEAKLAAMKRRCIEALEGPLVYDSPRSATNVFESYLSEKQKVAGLADEVSHLLTHRNDLEFQLKHQHQHVLALTAKISELSIEIPVVTVAEKNTHTTKLRAVLAQLWQSLVRFSQAP